MPHRYGLSPVWTCGVEWEFRFEMISSHGGISNSPSYDHFCRKLDWKSFYKSRIRMAYVQYASMGWRNRLEFKKRNRWNYRQTHIDVLLQIEMQMKTFPTPTANEPFAVRMRLFMFLQIRWSFEYSLANVTLRWFKLPVSGSSMSHQCAFTSKYFTAQIAGHRCFDFSRWRWSSLGSTSWFGFFCWRIQRFTILFRIFDRNDWLAYIRDGLNRHFHKAIFTFFVSNFIHLNGLRWKNFDCSLFRHQLWLKFYIELIVVNSTRRSFRPFLWFDTHRCRHLLLFWLEIIRFASNRVVKPQLVEQITDLDKTFEAIRTLLDLNRCRNLLFLRTGIPNLTNVALAQFRGGFWNWMIQLLKLVECNFLPTYLHHFQGISFPSNDDPPWISVSSRNDCDWHWKLAGLVNNGHFENNNKYDASVKAVIGWFAAAAVLPVWVFLDFNALHIRTK